MENDSIIRFILEFGIKKLPNEFTEKEFVEKIIKFTDENKIPKKDFLFLVSEYTVKYFVRNPENKKLLLGPEGYFIYQILSIADNLKKLTK
jgi:hypothetical protein